MVPRIRVHGDGLVMSMNCTKFDNGEMELRRTLGFFDKHGILQTTVFSDQRAQQGGTLSVASTGGDFVNRWTSCSNGNLIVYRHKFEYIIEIFGPDGQEIQQIHRQYTSLDRPQKEIDDEEAQMKDLIARMGANIEHNVQKVANDIARIIPRSNGNMWVLTSEGTRDLPENTIGTFDVFTADGRFERQVTIEVEYDRADDLFVVRGDYLYVLKEAQNAPARSSFSGGGRMVMASTGGIGGDEDDDEESEPYEVICYKLPAMN